jgi:hypothetical protein
MALLVAGALLAACTTPVTPDQEYPTLQPIDDLLAQADSAFAEPTP